MVLGGGVFLTANELQNKMEIPELVFINCCHLGTIDSPAGYSYNKFAASLSEELIKMGVKAVIAAGWAVDDAAAITFADVFYDQLLKGAQFGDAVKEARRQTYILHKDRTNTWAAYQCYGDPSYRLAAKKVGDRGVGDQFVHSEEASLEIRRLIGWAKATAVQGIGPLRDNLIAMEQAIAKKYPEWLEESSLQESLGEAFAEMLEFDKAVHYYQLAIQNKKCEASIKAIEQLANCRIRLAVQKLQADLDDYKTARSTIKKQIAELGLLIKTVGATTERWSMIGSGYKRLAQISKGRSPKALEEALNEMKVAYESAWEKAPDDPYPLTNTLVAKVILLLRSSDSDDIHNKLQDLLKDEEQATRLAGIARDNSPDDFWACIATTDVSLVAHMLDYIESGSTEVDQAPFDKLVEEYRETWNRFGSVRELNSVIDQYGFLLAMLNGIERHKSLADALTKIRSSLNSFSP
jgi:tetratricopeptide (TPR) repeat protein